MGGEIYIEKKGGGERKNARILKAELLNDTRSWKVGMVGKEKFPDSTQSRKEALCRRPIVESNAIETLTQLGDALEFSNFCFRLVLSTRTMNCKKRGWKEKFLGSKLFEIFFNLGMKRNFQVLRRNNIEEKLFTIRIGDSNS